MIRSSTGVTHPYVNELALANNFGAPAMPSGGANTFAFLKPGSCRADDDGDDSVTPTLVIVHAVRSSGSTTDTFPLCHHRPGGKDLFAGFDRFCDANWDGDGAKPILKSTIASARTFLQLLPSSVPPPAIAPGDDGSIGLEWIFDRGSVKKTFIDIGPNRRVKIYSRDAKDVVTQIRTTLVEFFRHRLSDVFLRI